MRMKKWFKRQIIVSLIFNGAFVSIYPVVSHNLGVKIKDNLNKYFSLNFKIMIDKIMR